MTLPVFDRIRPIRFRRAALIALALACTVSTVACDQLGGSSSPEEEALAELERRIEAAHKQFMQASRAAGLTGVDSTADVESARVDVQAVEREFQELKRKAGAGLEDLKDRMDRFEARLEEIKREFDLP